MKQSGLASGSKKTAAGKRRHRSSGRKIKNCRRPVRAAVSRTRSEQIRSGPTREWPSARQEVRRKTGFASKAARPFKNIVDVKAGADEARCGGQQIGCIPHDVSGWPGIGGAMDAGAERQSRNNQGVNIALFSNDPR